ncbi:PP2C family serine/threonine-protein phosphatase [Psychrobacter arenosus]|uniref:PP2C family protein-serine/threonine phosphatase n=1 Tax=Psychrobacter arenosus TaxID=256326 RepID=UPI001D116DB8|nr:protein phosphatase 2C domain-containing protein [Psychrobacter arenosus]
MTPSIDSTHALYDHAIAQACAITFQGNASNERQQDAFFFLEDWYQETLGVTEIIAVASPFCFAVSDGVASSNYSQHCSKAIVKAIKKLWTTDLNVTVAGICTLLRQTQHSPKRRGAAATLAMVTGQVSDADSITVQITHVRDSRVYRLTAGETHWQCLTRDHNLLNELVDEQAREQGRQANFADYNREGMAGSLYSITECFALTTEGDSTISEMPEASVQTVQIQSGDCLVICTDGIHDLVLVGSGNSLMRRRIYKLG